MESTLKTELKISKLEIYEYRCLKTTMSSGFMRTTGYVRIPDEHPLINLVKKTKWFDVGSSTYKLKKLQAKKEGKEFNEKKPKSHRYYRYDYDALPIVAHGGLTFAEKISTNKDGEEYSQRFTKGWWIGWDYMHLGDSMWDMEILKTSNPDIYAMETNSPLQSKNWTLEEVEKDCFNVIKQLKKYDK